MKKLGEIIWNIIEAITRFCLKILFKIIHKELTEETTQSFLQFVKFGIVGFINTFLSYFINVIVLKLLEPFNISWDFIAGNVIAFIISVFSSFMLNSHFVFKEEEGEKRNMWATLLKTYIAYGFTGIILANVLSFVWINILGISKYIAPLINLIVSVPVNFFMNKLWAYKS